jgi:hypothetical protein
MAEKHAMLNYTTATSQFFLQKLYTFVKTTQSGILQFATDGAYYGIRSGGTIQTVNTGFETGFGTNGDYLVIEPVNQYPGGGRWQIMFKAVTAASPTAANLTVETSWLGGWVQATSNFGANLTSAARQIIDFTTTTSDSLYFSCSNSDTYVNSSGIQTYTYIRTLFWRNAAGEDDKFQGVYCGGYIPTEPNNDTKPVVMFMRGARSDSQTGGWSHTTSLDAGIAPGNYAHSVAGGNISAFTNIISVVSTGYANTRSGNWSNGPLLILDNNNSTSLGAFGIYSQMTGALSRTDGAVDSNAEYIVSSNLTMRWKPSA